MGEHVEMEEVGGDQSKDKSTISDAAGKFGWYHLVLGLACFIRYAFAALMTNSGPLVAPDLQFRCKLPLEFQSKVAGLGPNQTLEQFLEGRCQVPLLDKSTYKCNEWTYNTSEFGHTLTDTYGLICERDYLKSLFQSAVTIGVAIASLLWGAISDQHGRKFAVHVGFFWSLKWGLWSYWTNSFAFYTISRALCTFGDIGVAGSLLTMVSELYGNTSRGPALTIVYTGWSVGVLGMPWIVTWVKDYRKSMLVLVAIHIATAPLLMLVKESPRWLLVRGKLDAAKSELLRIRKLSLVRKTPANEEQDLIIFESTFTKLSSRFKSVSDTIDATNTTTEADQTPASGYFKSKIEKFRATLSFLGGTFSHIKEFYRSKEMAFTTTLIIWITFNSELYYMFFVMVNSDVGASMKTNYAVGFLMEILAMVCISVMSSVMNRKSSMYSTCLAIMFFSALLAWRHDTSTTAAVLLNITKFAVSNLTSLVCIIQTELFPTNLRQTGQGFAFALGSLGAITAPFVRQELASAIGLSNVFLSVAGSAALLTASVYLLRETKGVELADIVDDISFNPQPDQPQAGGVTN